MTENLIADSYFSDAETVAWTTSAQGASQVELEQLFANSQLISTMRKEFGTTFSEDIFALNSLAIEQGIPCSLAFILDLMVQAAIHKRARIEVIVGILNYYFQEEENPYQACANAIHFCASHDVVDLLPSERNNGEDIIYEVIVRYEVSPATQDRIDQYQYPLPMIEPPLEVTNNKQTGYRTLKGSLILKRNHHDEDICLDHINRCNAVNLDVNPDVVAFIQNSWKNLDRQKHDESYPDFQKRKRAFEKYDRNSRDVLDAMALQTQGFWLTHKYDKRGRTYSQGYHVNYQGNDWNKACVMFHEAETLNKE